jgi:hypothetical protein
MSSGDAEQRSWKDYALALQIGVVQIPFYLLAIPRDQELGRALTTVAFLFLISGAIAGALGPERWWLMGLLVATPLWVLAGPTLAAMTPREELLGLDLPLFSAGLVFALLGSFLGKVLAQKRTKNPPAEGGDGETSRTKR